MGIDELKDRLLAADYTVDAGAVAEAMLKRPSVLLLLHPGLLRPGDARSPAAPPPARPA
jgi:hypothetical protein